MPQFRYKLWLIGAALCSCSVGRVAEMGATATPRAKTVTNAKPKASGIYGHLTERFIGKDTIPHYSDKGFPIQVLDAKTGQLVAQGFVTRWSTFQIPVPPGRYRLAPGVSYALDLNPPIAQVYAGHFSRADITIPLNHALPPHTELTPPPPVSH